MKTFENMLATANSAAQNTLINAMVEWWMAKDHEDAKEKINAAPGSDLAGITNSVVSGLTALAEQLGIDSNELISEEKLHALEAATPEQIVIALDAIHRQWVSDNFTARRWAEKFFKGQLPQYRKTAKLAWDEVVKDLLFIADYLIKGGNFICSNEEIQSAFVVYAEENSDDSDLTFIEKQARTFAPEIIEWIVAFRDKLDPEKKASQIEEINKFLDEHTDGAEIMEIMIKSVSE